MSAEVPKQRRTLMDAVSSLKDKVDMASRIRQESYFLLCKLKRIEPVPDAENKKDSIAKPDIVEIFDVLSGDFQEIISETLENIRICQSFID